MKSVEYGLRSTDSAVFLKALFGPYGGGSDSRPQKVVEWGFHLDDHHGQVFWDVVTEAWSSFDRIPHRDFEVLFKRFGQSAPTVADLPAWFTVYRGQNSVEPNGLSWTRNEKVAEDFARGHRSISYAAPTIIEMEIERKVIAFVCSDRDEDEVVLRCIPPTSLNIRSRSVAALSS